MRSKLSFLVAMLLLLGPLAALGAPLPEAKPEDVGMSSERLERLSALMNKAVEAGDIPGGVVMIARDGKLVYQKTFGMQDKAKGVPMAADSVFRIFSMTKPVVSVAAMILVEEGRLGLHEPISKYLPEFKEMKVGNEIFEPGTGAMTFTIMPAKRQITVQDLLRHTSGLIYGPFAAKTHIGKLYQEADLFAAPTLDAFCKTLARIPLRNEPGTVWEYGHSTDVLGRVVEVASGQPLNVFVSERILKPLRMTDTDWYVPAGKLARFAQPNPGSEKDWEPALLKLDWTRPATLFAGGHGLVSTAGDYLRFAQMLASGGELDGVRILGPHTIAYMASDHVMSAAINKGPNWLPGPGYGFGLGFGTRETAGGSVWAGSVGDFFWGGYAGTYFWIDPKERLVPVLMTQEVAKRNHFRFMVRNLVYQALLD
jgi:CubicO group peptidase (beta-lactamase class C family)